MAAVTQTSAPRRIESTLLVVESFTDQGGTEWRSGDRASLGYRNVRRAAREHPEWFRMEFETLPVDLEWLADLDAKYDADYQQAKRVREEAEARRQRAIREEFEAQGHGPSRNQRELERRFKQQEKERAEREKAARADRERQQLEKEFALDVRPGFHFDSN
jgi:Skp family chaperone for outer membrane proteins